MNFSVGKLIEAGDNIKQKYRSTEYIKNNDNIFYNDNNALQDQHKLTPLMICTYDGQKPLYELFKPSPQKRS